MPGKEEGQTKKNYHHGNLREALIQAGLELILDGGASQLDLRKVARKAGVSHTAPYRHFADKKALLAAIAEEGYREMASRIHRALEGTPDQFEVKLHVFAKEYVDFAMKHPQLMREMFSGLIIEIKDYPSLYEAVTHLFQPLISIIRRAQDTKEIADLDHTASALVIWSMMHGLSTLLIENMLQRVTSKPDGVERMIRLCVRTLHTGFIQKDAE